jgi:hypothetical protein
MMKYRVESLGCRATRLVYSQRCATIASATRVFMQQARLHIADRDSCVLLVRTRDTLSGTVLAHKSTDSVDTIFSQAYWRE